ncbi:MAG: acyltransferase 3 [Tardiphaga sp.]|nr:acyltransferase 3 [Tardiphaga sp.]MDB5624459.1 acyltransferase 3 [Tardiphaga sp.]
MTAMTNTTTPAQAWPRESTRNMALDRARTFLTIVVLIHHAVIPYTFFGHTDAKNWIGFDAIVLANDSYFMAMFFFLSGLFVWPSLAHRAPGEFTKDRLLRLGLPFAIGALTIIPLAYYAVEPRDQHPGFIAFWWKTITQGPWPAGPIWFTWVLLVFGVIAGLIYRLVSPRSIDPLNRLSQKGFARPLTYFLVFVAVTALIYVPARLYYGPSQWFALGPIAVQASRVLLYATYFAFGIGIGAAGFSSGLLGAQGALPKQWLGWMIAALIPYLAMWMLIWIKRDVIGNPGTPPPWYEFCYGLAFVVFSAAMLFALLAYFLRFKTAGRSLLDPLRHDAYGIFLVHYVFVLWIQYYLFDIDAPAIAKALIAFGGTLALSWATSALLRQIPGAKKVL